MTPVKTLDHTDSDKAKISVWNPPWKIIFICKKKTKQTTTTTTTTPKKISMDRSDLAMYLITVLEYL